MIFGSKTHEVSISYMNHMRWKQDIGLELEDEDCLAHLSIHSCNFKIWSKKLGFSFATVLPF